MVADRSPLYAEDEESPLSYNTDTGEWTIRRPGSVSESYGLDSGTPLRTALSRDEMESRLGNLEYSEQSPFELEDMPYKDPFDWEGFASESAPGGDYDSSVWDGKQESYDPNVWDEGPFAGEASIRRREPEEQEWYLYNLAKHLAIGYAPEEFKFGDNVPPTSDEIKAAQAKLAVKQSPTKEGAVQNYVEQTLGEEGQALPPVDTPSGQATIGPATWRDFRHPAVRPPEKRFKPGAWLGEAAEQAGEFVGEFGGRDVDWLSTMPDKTGTGTAWPAIEPIPEDKSVEQIISEQEEGAKVGGPPDLSEDDMNKLLASQSADLTPPASIALPDDPAPPPEDTEDSAENLFTYGRTVSSGEYDKQYSILDSPNQPAAWAGYDLQIASQLASELKGRSPQGGIQFTDFGKRPLEKQMEAHPGWSEERAKKGKHVSASAIDIDTQKQGRDSPEFKWMQKNAYHFCYYWPAVKDDSGNVEYHHWEHDCSAAKRQAKAWGLDESLTGSKAVSQDKYGKGILQAGVDASRTPAKRGPDFSLMSPVERGEMLSSEVPVHTVWAPGSGKYISLNPNMSQDDLRKLVKDQERQLRGLYPENSLLVADKTRRFLEDVQKNWAKESSQWYSTNEKLNEQAAQIAGQQQGILTKIADHKQKDAHITAEASRVVTDAHNEAMLEKEGLLKRWQADTTEHEKFLRESEPDQFRLFGWTDKDGKFSASKLAFTMLSIPALIVNIAATLGSKGRNRVPLVMWDLLSGMMDNDMRAQESAVNNRINEFNSKRTSYGYWLAHWKDKPLARQKAYADLVNAGADRLKVLEAGQKDPFIRLNIRNARNIFEQKSRGERIKFFDMLETKAQGRLTHLMKGMQDEQTVKGNAWKTRFEIYGKVLKEEGKNKVTNLPGPLRKTLVISKSLIPKIREARELWIKYGKDNFASSVLKKIAGLNPDTDLHKWARMEPVRGWIGALTGTKKEQFQGLLRIAHLRRTLAAATSKQSGNVGNDNMMEQINGMWNWPLEDGYEDGLLYLDKFEANATLMSTPEFYTMQGFQDTKSDFTARGQHTKEYSGSAVYNTLLEQLDMAQKSGDQRRQIELIQAFNRGLGANPEAGLVDTEETSSVGLPPLGAATRRN